MDLVILIYVAIAFVGGIAANHFRLELAKWYATKKKKPFFKVVVEYDHSNTAGVETMVNGVYPVEVSVKADFNEDFVQRLDSYYISKGDAEYNPMADNNEKVLVYLYDVISSIAEPVLGDDEMPPMDDINNIPPLAYRGGAENKVVVDIDNPNDPSNPGPKEFYGG